MIRKITICSVNRPPRCSVNDELQWLANALGLFGERDRNRSRFRIFVELIKTSRTKSGLTSDELAHRLSLTRPTVVHHLNGLLEQGLIIHRSNRYEMRAQRLQELIEDLRKDMERALDEVKQSARELDKVLGL
ncbi:ArsR family transcriptional regulator [Candidatus Woesearchaeota archaeon]|nr:MAG: ArsR family transcriptional regulator [Candidatus Woesearchaeota archaeon]